MCMSMYVHGVSDHDTTRTAARLFPLVVNCVLGLKAVRGLDLASYFIRLEVITPYTALYFATKAL